MSRDSGLVVEQELSCSTSFHPGRFSAHADQGTDMDMEGTCTRGAYARGGVGHDAMHLQTHWLSCGCCPQRSASEWSGSPTQTPAMRLCRTGCGACAVCAPCAC